jgi:hypothetical protein
MTSSSSDIRNTEPMTRVSRHDGSLLKPGGRGADSDIGVMPQCQKSPGYTAHKAWKTVTLNELLLFVNRGSRTVVVCSWACPALDVGAKGVSFKIEKQRETGKYSATRGQRRRAAQQHQSFPCIALHGCFREALRPPHPSPKADHRAAISSFLYFERDPPGPLGKHL